ncbi:hypothetical protein CPB83DRAFT_844794 [Crepidotus variabilis]|uniref:PARP catalytic domain-containing protein n=1 Tax=Crepidotus variabilis TaxID=179855 RepID=A0A9P6ESA8_9AGAR|nr:hypothetical protein CPB83DRAFT_844794 [Crepidotus variabilis]
MSTVSDSFSLEHPDNKGFSESNKLRRLLPQSIEFSQVQRAFIKEWRHRDKKKPTTKTIFKILAPAEHLESFNMYRGEVALQRSFNFFSSNKANEKLLFHGTNRMCTLGEDRGKAFLCDLLFCSLCSIIQNSFDIGKCGTKHSFRRFGTGIYTTTCSSKADGYSTNGDETCQFKAILVNRVVVGNPHKLQINATPLTKPPKGRHSVVGRPGKSLAYEETVVYTNDAIRPAYLVIYGDIISQTRTRVLKKKSLRPQSEIDSSCSQTNALMEKPAKKNNKLSKKPSHWSSFMEDPYSPRTN